MSVREEQFVYMNKQNQKIIEDLSLNNKIRVFMGNDIQSLEESDGKIMVHFEDDTKSEIFDRIVYALGGTTPINFLKVVGVDFRNGVPHLTKNYETSIEGLYLIGDIGSGKKGGAIIHAFNSSYLAMQDIISKQEGK